MPSVTLYPPNEKANDTRSNVHNTLPHLLRTPSGLAIVELQGTIHAPFPESNESEINTNASQQFQTQTPIGKLEFPLYNPELGSGDSKWMKRAYLYVGKHQRLTGEAKKLSKPLAVIGKRANLPQNHHTLGIDANDPQIEELEILEIVKYKIIFGGRPEPVGNEDDVDHI